MLEEAKDITQMLHDARLGNDSAAEELMGAVYTSLKKVAGRYMRAEREDHTLEPTAIVHEAFLRMFQPSQGVDGGPLGPWKSVPIDWQSRAHFLGVAAKQMRQVLIDHGRGKSANKRAGLKVSVDDARDLAAVPTQDFGKLDQMLTLLATKDPEAARVVELKFFGGLTDKEAAEVMGINIPKLRRNWEFARSWLRHRMEPPA